MTENYSEIVSRARNAFDRNVTTPVDFRVKQLKALLRIFEIHENEIMEAIASDMKRPYPEVVLVEVDHIKYSIRTLLSEIHQWVKPTPVSKTLFVMLDEVFVLPQPLGVVLIIGSWNFPVALIIQPLMGAIAAGNCAILKPSEKAPTVGKLLEELLSKYLDQDCFHVINGGEEQVKELLKERFDYIFFTGSVAIGQKVREASNKYLTPVTLEMGGKNPVYIDDKNDLASVAKRLVSAKMVSLGQTCLSPNYVLCHRSVHDDFIVHLRAAVNEFYGENPKLSPDLSRMLNDQHFNRVVELLSSGKIAVGGDYDASERYIGPTILTDVNDSDPVMQEEIFGPIIPVVAIDSAEEAIKFIKKREKPLALYVYSTNRDTINKFLSSTYSGSICINDAGIQVTVDSLPFGGVGMSGMGRYFGKYTFDTFSHQRAVFIRSCSAFSKYIDQLRFPPYSEKKLNILKYAMRKQPNFTFLPIFWCVIAFLLGMLFKNY